MRLSYKMLIWSSGGSATLKAEDKGPIWAMEDGQIGEVLGCRHDLKRDVCYI